MAVTLAIGVTPCFIGLNACHKRQTMTNIQYNPRLGVKKCFAVGHRQKISNSNSLLDDIRNVSQQKSQKATIS
jgi:hypothetical protein